MLMSKLLSFILVNYLDGEDYKFDSDTPLLELNIIDSSSLFDLVEYLRKETGVAIPLEEIVPPNFSSVRNMVSLVQRIKSEQNYSVLK